MKYLVCLLVMLMMVVGCGKVSTSNIDSYVSLPSSDVRAFLTNAAPQWNDAVRLKDSEYVLPTEDWVKGKFTSTLGKFMFDYNVRWYQDERNDCDDFALYGRAIASVLNRHNPEGKGKGVAVGEADILWGLDAHAMNFIVVAGPDKKPKLIFYEPQVQRIVQVETNYDFMVLFFEM